MVVVNTSFNNTLVFLFLVPPQQAFTCSKSTVVIRKQHVKYNQSLVSFLLTLTYSHIVLVSSLLTLDK